MMSPQEYENQSKTSRQINFLLTKAVDLINKMTSKKKVPDTEGMDAALMAEVVKKATVRIPAYPRGAPIRIEYSYDVDGIIRVRVFDLV